MNEAQFLKNLEVPKGKIDIVLDTDAFNEVDDQFAISYMLKSPEKFNVKGICAAPFLNTRSVSALDGMEKSYNEILKLLKLMEMPDLSRIVYKGSSDFLKDEQTPSESDAAEFLAQLANAYSPENPLYIVSIGAITNVASAMLKNPKMCENTVILFLGGRARGTVNPACEFNMKQDIAAARIIFSSGVPFIQIAGKGVTDRLLTTKPELEYWLKGKNKLCDYLCENVIEEAEALKTGRAWSRVIWDAVAIARFFNESGKWLEELIVPAHIPEYDLTYSFDETRHKMKYIEWVERDAIFTHLFETLAK